VNLEPHFLISASFIAGVLIGGTVGWISGAHFAGPREETEISYEQRGWIFRTWSKVTKRRIKYNGITISENVQERKVRQHVDMDTVVGLRREAETFAHRVLRFRPLSTVLRKLLGG